MEFGSAFLELTGKVIILISGDSAGHGVTFLPDKRKSRAPSFLDPGFLKRVDSYY